MKEVYDNEAKKIRGGGISVSFINAVISLSKLFFELGRSLGSSIRRGHNVCQLR